MFNSTAFIKLKCVHILLLWHSRQNIVATINGIFSSSPFLVTYWQIKKKWASSLKWRSLSWQIKGEGDVGGLHSGCKSLDSQGCLLARILKTIWWTWLVETVTQFLPWLMGSPSSPCNWCLPPCPSPPFLLCLPPCPISQQYPSRLGFVKTLD